ncbi:MAG: chromosomal replication initiator protein DnaA [Erysipelothrix sp.]|nr:chromosomal replication initiator protein DnaA [Erysipelothrix sp.]
MTTVQIFLDEVWNKTLSIIKESQHFDDSVFKNFYENDTKLISLDDNIAIIQVPFTVNQIIINQEKNFIIDCLKQVNESITNLEAVLPNETFKNITNQVNMSQSNDNIISNYTFENFVVGPSNKQSQSAALACAFSPGQLYTPLFIFGNSGLGKTHLLHAVGNYCLDNHPNMKILYIQCSDFVDKVSKSILNKTISSFKSELSELDVLLIDDIQFLAGGKEKSQEVFFQIFNTLYQKNKQIIITSDRNPTEISGLEDRLVSRFGMGLSVSVSSPAFDTSRAILKQKIQSQSYDSELIDNEVIDYLATNFSKDIRQLEGALTRLLFFGINFENDNKITLQTAINAFKGQSSIKETQELTISKIKRVVCDYYGITKTQLVSKVRTKQIANARHIAIHLSRKHLDLPFVKIGEEFGKRDHSTVINSVETVDKKIKADPIFLQAYSEIEKALLTN